MAGYPRQRQRSTSLKSKSLTNFKITALFLKKKTPISKKNARIYKKNAKISKKTTRFLKKKFKDLNKKIQDSEQKTEILRADRLKLVDASETSPKQS